MDKQAYLEKLRRLKELKDLKVSQQAPKSPESVPSALEAAGRGTLQGVTAGTSDEGIGAARGLLDDLKSVFSSEASAGPKPAYDEHGRITNQNELTGTYSQHRDAERTANKAAEQAHPLAYGGGQIAGGVATGLLTGGAGVGRLAAEGAVHGLGASESEDVTGVAKDALLGGGAGIGGAALGKVTSKVGNAILNASTPAATTLEVGRKVGDTISKRMGAASGATMGGAVGGIPGAIAGGVAGEGIERYGGRVVNAVADKLTPAANMADQAFQKVTGVARERLSPKYQKILQDAQARGGRSLAITHFLLSNEDPDYQAQTSQSGSK